MRLYGIRPSLNTTPQSKIEDLILFGKTNKLLEQSA